MTVVMETRGMARTEPAVCARLEHDVIRWNRHHALAFCLSMISAQTRSAFVARENRFPLFRIMLLNGGASQTARDGLRATLISLPHNHPMIRLDNVSKQVGHQILFIEASTALQRGEKIGIVGPNGA